LPNRRPDHSLGRAYYFAAEYILLLLISLITASMVKNTWFLSWSENSFMSFSLLTTSGSFEQFVVICFPQEIADRGVQQGSQFLGHIYGRCRLDPLVPPDHFPGTPLFYQIGLKLIPFFTQVYYDFPRVFYLK
jgi:hypothetical protein